MTHIIIIYNFSLIEWMQNDKIVQKSVSQSSNCKAIPITLYICVRVEFKFRLGDGKFDCYHFWLLCDFRWCLLYRNRAVYFQKKLRVYRAQNRNCFQNSFCCLCVSFSFVLTLGMSQSKHYVVLLYIVFVFYLFFT